MAQVLLHLAEATWVGSPDLIQVRHGGVCLGPR